MKNLIQHIEFHELTDERTYETAIVAPLTFRKEYKFNHSKCCTSERDKKQMIREIKESLAIEMRNKLADIIIGEL